MGALFAVVFVLVNRRYGDKLRPRVTACDRGDHHGDLPIVGKPAHQRCVVRQAGNRDAAAAPQRRRAARLPRVPGRRPVQVPPLLDAQPGPPLEHDRAHVRSFRRAGARSSERTRAGGGPLAGARLLNAACVCGRSLTPATGRTPASQAKKIPAQWTSRTSSMTIRTARSVSTTSAFGPEKSHG
jgi:hypothetical protein